MDPGLELYQCLGKANLDLSISSRSLGLPVSTTTTLLRWFHTRLFTAVGFAIQINIFALLHLHKYPQHWKACDRAKYQYESHGIMTVDI